MNVPSNLSYTKEHEWAKISGTTATIGITDHAQSALGDVVFVDLPKVGRALKAGEVFGAVESIKAVSDLFSPLEGVVTEINPALSAEPGTINKDPYDKAWLIKVELKSGATQPELMSAPAYEKLISGLN
jgi:glycine cleavage system H protein